MTDRGRRKKTNPSASVSKRFRNLSDVEIIDLMHSMGDGLPREVVDEALDRGSRIIPYLYVIVSDKSAWTRPLPDWWATVHATYILGAFEAPETLPALLSALRWADAFDCEWVTEDLPSMFGRLGEISYAPLQAVALDASAGWGARSIALSSMAAVTLKERQLRERFLDFAAHILSDVTEPVPLRQTAANVLMDFRSGAHRQLLLMFGREESQRKEEIPEYEGVFYDYEVDEFLNDGEGQKDLYYYRRDWLAFYEPDERERRREFWDEEQQTLKRELDETEQAEKNFDPGMVTLCPCGSGRSYADCCLKKMH